MDILIREREAAQRLGVSVKTLQSWRLHCRGPVYAKIGKSVRYRLEDLDAFVQSKLIQPQAGAVR